MPKTRLSAQNQAVNKVFLIISVIMTLALLVLAGLAWWGYSFSTSMVKSELSAQKIYFPPSNSPALLASEYPDLQKYGGQLVDTGPEAKAYANDYIGSHLKKVANGKVYAEVSAEAQKDPQNQKLQQQKQTLFQGETLRGILLGTGYAYWLIGSLAKIAALVLIVCSLVTSILALYFVRRLKG